MSRGRRFVVVDAPEAARGDLGRLSMALRALAVWAASADEALAEPPGQVSAWLVNAGLGEPGAPQLCRRLRRVSPPAASAIVVFGSRVDSVSLIEALDSGADLIWSLPLNLPVCEAYLKAILRRVSRLEAGAPAIACGEFSLEPARRRASLEGAPLELRAKEFDLLYALARRPGEALSREALMREVWGTEYSGTTRTIDFHVSQLRRKLGGAGRRIETVAGLGYRFSAEAAYGKLT